MQDQDSASETQAARNSRRRASKACLACRARKVRCDVVHRDGQCTNCFLDKRQCLVKPRPSKYRSSKKKAAENLEAANGQAAGASQHHEQQPQQENASLEVPSLNPAIQETMSERSSEQDQTSPEFSLDPLLENPNHEDLLESIQGDGKDHDPQGFTTAPDTWDARPTHRLDTASGKGYVDQVHVIYSYFPFLKLDLSLLSEHDVQFLEAQGCFKVPGRQATDEFVREYFLHVHPTLPLLDECVFWEMYSQAGCASSKHRASLSLFIFQSMLFAASSFLPATTIRQLGFTSLRDARSTYYRRAKLLFDFCQETDQVANAQGALLLTYNASMRDQRRANSIWLATAIQLAQAAGAHRFHFNPNQKPEAKNALKRLWWCCIVRDRILPLGVRRQLHLSLTDFDVEKTVLTEEDFASEITTSQVYEAETKRSLIRLFIMLCDLAISLTDVIKTAYATCQPFDMGSSNMEKLHKAVNSIQSCKLGLDSWFERATIRFPTPAGIGCTNESLILYTNLMYIYYHSGRLALYQYEALVLSTGSIGLQLDDSALSQSRIQLEDAAAGITDNLKELIQLKLGRYLPISIVAYAALPLVLHILDVRLSTKPSQKAQKQGRLNVYMEAMKGLETQYDGVDEVWELIKTTVEYATVEDSRRPPLQALELARSSPTQMDPMKGFPLKGSGPMKLSDWGHLFIRKPTLYFTVALTIDHSLSLGRYAQNSNFPLLPSSPSVSRLLLCSAQDQERINQEQNQNQSQNPKNTESASQFVPMNDETIHFQGLKEMPDHNASALRITDGFDGTVGLDYGFDDLQIPMLMDDFEFIV